MSTQTQVAKKSEAQVEFIPHGSQDKLKLTVAMVKSMLAVPTKSKKYPEDKDCIKFIALCQARKLNPFEGDAFLIGYDTKDGPVFNLITAHQAFLKRAETHPQFNGMRSGVIVERDGNLVDLEGDFHLETDKVIGGWASVYFKNRQHPMIKRLRLKRFQKPWGIWQEDPAGMIVKCTEADALRSSFPTMLGGMYMREEMKEDQGTVAMTAPIFTPPPVDTASQPEPELKPLTPKEKVKHLCEESGISEEDLVDFLGNKEIAEPDDVKIDDLSDAAVDNVLEKWDAIEHEIKQELERQKA